MKWAYQQMKGDALASKPPHIDERRYYVAALLREQQRCSISACTPRGNVEHTIPGRISIFSIARSKLPPGRDL